MTDNHKLRLMLLLPLLMLWSDSSSLAQRGIPPVSRSAGFAIFGDLEVSGAGAEDKPLTFDLLLYSRTGVTLDRQRVGSKGRYRFNNVPQGDYDVVVEFENTEISRTHVKLTGTLTDFRQDIALEWRSGPSTVKPRLPTVISAEDVYNRQSPNKERFEKAEEAFDKKEYDKAVALFRKIVSDDPQDFQSWTELGTVSLAQKNLDEAEKSYQRATEIRPTFFLGLLNLGRLQLDQKKFDAAIDCLSQAVTLRPSSPEANYFLGEAYLQVKQGSKAVGYLNEAIRLDPIRKADAHLRLAALYNGAGLKEKAAAEYEVFLRKKPDYPERKKLDQYIAANKTRND